MRYLVIEDDVVVNVVEGPRPTGYGNSAHKWVARDGAAAEAWIGWTRDADGVFSPPPPPVMPPEPEAA